MGRGEMTEKKWPESFRAGLTVKLRIRGWYYDLSLDIWTVRGREFKWYPAKKGHGAQGNWQLWVRFLWFCLGANGIRLEEAAE